MAAESDTAGRRWLVKMTTVSLPVSQSLLMEEPGFFSNLNKMTQTLFFALLGLANAQVELTARQNDASFERRQTVCTC